MLTTLNFMTAKCLHIQWSMCFNWPQVVKNLNWCSIFRMQLPRIQPATVGCNSHVMYFSHKMDISVAMSFNEDGYSFETWHRIAWGSTDHRTCLVHTTWTYPHWNLCPRQEPVANPPLPFLLNLRSSQTSIYYPNPTFGRKIAGIPLLPRTQSSTHTLLTKDLLSHCAFTPDHHMHMQPRSIQMAKYIYIYPTQPTCKKKQHQQLWVATLTWIFGHTGWTCLLQCTAMKMVVTCMCCTPCSPDPYRWQYIHKNIWGCTSVCPSATPFWQCSPWPRFEQIRTRTLLWIHGWQWNTT